MKKTLIIAAIAGLAMASCKKDRTCTCVQASTAAGSVSSTQVLTYHKVSSKDAKELCVSYTQQTTAPVSGETTSWTCTIK
jgi:hypothetical protein